MAVVAGFAILGALREVPWPYIAAIILALPAGAVAFVAVYGGYALLSAIGGLFTETELPDGSTPAWLTTSSAILNVLLITAAAVVNMIALRWWQRRRSHAHPSPLGG